MIKTLKEIWEYRTMIRSLVHKDLRGRYQASVLGFLWTFIVPLCQLLVYTVVFSVILRSTVEKFYLYLFVALIPWNFFSACLTGGSSCIIQQQSLVNKIYFPREVIPVAYVTSSFVNMLYCEIVVFAVALFSGITGEDLRMTFAGGLADGTEEDFFPAGCGCGYAGSLSGEALQRQYAETEVLVNIGNAVDNQMPSKIFEYISTGKPIINIFKSTDCPTLKYLGRYPLVLNIHEAEIRKDPAGCVSRVQAFCRGHRGERVPAEETKRLYAANTFEAFTESICRAIEGEEDKA